MGVSERSLGKVASNNGAPDSSESLGRAVTNVIRAAEESAEALRQEARAEANEALEQAIEKAERIGHEAADKAVSLLDEAAGKAERLTYEAERHARELRETAQQQCEGMLQTVLQRQQWLKSQENELAARLQRAQETVVKLRSLLVPVGERPELTGSDDPPATTALPRGEEMLALGADATDKEGAADGSPRTTTD